MDRSLVLGCRMQLLAAFLVCAARVLGAENLAPVVDSLAPPLPPPSLPSVGVTGGEDWDESVMQWTDFCGQCGGVGCGNCQGVSGPCGSGLKLFGGVEYLEARPNSSQSLAFIRQVQSTVADANGVREDITQDVNFQFERKDTIRAFIGFRRPDCRSELRFTYWRLRSDDQVTAAAGTDAAGNDVSYSIWDVNAELPGDQLFAASRLAGDIFDVQYRRCLRGMDSCDNAGACCLPWDLHWSAGVRIAEWDHESSVFSTSTSQTRADESMEFDGAGPMVGLNSRRRLGILPCVSAFASFQTALLLGQYDHRLVRTAVVGPNTSREVFLTGEKRIVPVTEFEVGLAWQFGRYLNISGGWFQQVWWDLGMSAETARGDIQLVRDDSNIMAWDGFTLRAEFAF